MTFISPSSETGLPMCAVKPAAKAFSTPRLEPAPVSANSRRARVGGALPERCVHAGHADIRHHQVEPLPFDQVGRFLPAGGADDLRVFQRSISTSLSPLSHPGFHP